MHTFSQMVDEMVSETKRPDLVNEIARYVNQTIREIHFTSDRNAAVFFTSNLQEAMIVADHDSRLVWEMPDPTRFQKMLGVKYFNSLDSAGDAVWARETSPGRHMNDLCHFYYRVGGTFAFHGFGGLNSQVGLAWYEFPRSLKYKVPAARPAEYDVDSGWVYDPLVNTPELEEGARELTSNWLLLRWTDVIAEGVRAKVYKRLSDDARSRTCYSLYQSLRQGLITSETAELYGG